MNSAQLRQRIESAWAALTESYAGLTPEQMTQPGVTGDWSVKDILAHVTIWEQEALTHLPTVMAGRRPPRYADTGGIDAFNAREVAAKAALPLAEVLRQREETHHRLLAYLDTVPEEQIRTETRFRHRLRLDTWSHYPIHTRAIREWREGLSNSEHDGSGRPSTT
jgi:hypothetical protein